MFLPSSSSPLSVAHTEEDAHFCSQFNNTRKNFISVGGSSFEEKGIQLYYENFRIEIVSSSVLLLILCLSSITFINGLASSLLNYNEIWLLRIALVIRILICCVGFYTYYKIFHLRVRPETSTKSDFHQYVSSVVNLSNFLIISLAVVNGFVYAWKSSLGSCLHVQDGSTEVINNDYYFFNCNSSYEIGSTPTDSMVVLLVGNILVISTLRSHSYWAMWTSYIVTLACVIAGAAVSRSPFTSSSTIFLAIMSIFVFNGMEFNNLTMFTALLELASTNRIKTTELKHFVGNVAHDLKTPLHGFTMCVDHVLIDTSQHIPDGKKKDEIVDQLQMCKTNCAFMSAAINRTVDFAKSASDIALLAKMEPTSVTDAMQWAVTCLNSSQPTVSIKMEPLPSDICDIVVTDKHWLMENVLCYLSNAVKYSASGNVTVSACLCDGDDGVPLDNKKVSGSSFETTTSSSTYKASWESRKRKIFSRYLEVHPGGQPVLNELCSFSDDDIKPPPSQLRITVEDEGIGVDDDMKKSLFKPFQQTMRLAGGSGLGLFSLSKRIEVLKGHYGVDNRTDGCQGSRFWFSIPYAPDAASANSVSLMREESFDCSIRIKDGLGAGTEAPTALVVEDSVVISKATSRMLKKAGYEVDVAENGAIGLEKMKAKDYSTVVMDLQMPVMDGLEATRRLRAYEKSEEFESSGKRPQFIIGASANGADDVMRDALASGMDFFIEKPFSVSILADCQQQSLVAESDSLV